MRSWSECRLIDIFSNIDLSMLEEDSLEADLVDLEHADLWETKKEKWSKKKIAVITGIAAGSVALTGAVFLFAKKGNWLKKAA